MQATVQRDFTPNDPGWLNLWGLNNTGQSGGLIGFDMSCDEAWDITTGSAEVKILVLDDGTELFHTDLNLGAGADFTGQGTGGGPGNSCDNHGTAVAGCVSAIVNNGVGSIGVAPDCLVLPAKFTISNVPCDAAGTFQFSWLASALAWGAAQGARVSNNSNGLPSSSTVTSQYNSTYSGGMIHFTSAGNDGTSGVGYPGSLASVNAISATNRYGNLASFSSYGSAVSLAAPGQTIYTTDRMGGNGYSAGDHTYVDGTSFSSPYAAGVAALLLSVEPGLTASQAEDHLRTTAVDLGPAGFDIEYGYGHVNAYNAVEHAAFYLDSDVALGLAPLTVNFEGTTNRPATGWTWLFGDGGSAAQQNPTHEYLDPGFYSVEATIEVGEDNYSKVVDGMISVHADSVLSGNGQFDDNNVGRVDIYVRNYLPLKEITIPFSWAADIDVDYDSISTAGFRSDFMSAYLVSIVPSWSSATVYLDAVSEPYLEPGSGPVVSLYFTLNEPGAIGSVPIDLSGYASFQVELNSYAGDYDPFVQSGEIIADCCRGIVGDVNGDGGYLPTIGDISLLINYLFMAGSPLSCYPEADANQSGSIDPGPEDITIGDISVLIDYLFVTGTPLPSCL
jgi:PKD repeat protein